MVQRFGAFEIVRALGRGGMAETSVALRRGEDGFEQTVCLKRILPAFGSDAEFVRAFRDEARLAVRLVHPNVCRLYDFGVHQGTWWMSLELVEGGDLRALLSSLRAMRQPMPIDVVLLLAIDLATALHYAHRLVIDGVPADIVHRDLSPSNVLVDAHGHFKLADFGIARARTHGHVTQSGVVKGKVPYMAPEHAMGQHLDARADLWSLGVVLYECLAGSRPFTGVHDVETLLAITTGRRRPVREAAPDAPPALQSVIERLLSLDPSARTAQASDVLGALAPITPPATARLRLAELIARIGSEPIEAAPAHGAQGAALAHDAALAGARGAAHDTALAGARGAAHDTALAGARGAAPAHDTAPARTRRIDGAPPAALPDRAVLPAGARESTRTAPAERRLNVRAGARTEPDLAPPAFDAPPLGPSAAPLALKTGSKAPEPSAPPLGAGFGAPPEPLGAGAPRELSARSAQRGLAAAQLAPREPSAAPVAMNEGAEASTPMSTEASSSARPSRDPAAGQSSWRTGFVLPGLISAAVFFVVGLAASWIVLRAANDSWWTSAARPDPGSAALGSGELRPGDGGPASGSLIGPASGGRIPLLTAPLGGASITPDGGPDADRIALYGGPAASGRIGLDGGAGSGRIGLDGGAGSGRIGLDGGAGSGRIAPDGGGAPSDSGTLERAGADPRATLTLVAVPYGGLWIDGEPAGAGRAIRRLPPGRHRVAAGSDSPGPSQTITLAPGERRTITLRWRR